MVNSKRGVMDISNDKLNYSKTEIASRLLESDVFIRDIKKYQNTLVKPFLDFVQRNIYSTGLTFLNSKKNEKLLSTVGDKVFEFRSPIKGHRILFKYGWQLKETKYSVNENDIILCKYVNDHDDINKAATSIREEDFLNLNEHDFEVNIGNDKTEEDKIYVYNTNEEYLLPILDKEQEKILKCNEKYVLVNGIAGSGKTNLCVQKVLLEAISNRKVVYSTFSNNLLRSTQECIEHNYLHEIKEVVDDINQNGLNNKAVLHKINNLNLNINLNDEDVTISKNLNEICNKINTIEYSFLEDICRDKDKDKKIVNLKIFNNLIKSNEFSYALKNKFKESNISIEVLFKEIEGIILGLATDNEIISYDEYKRERNNAFNDKTLHIIYSIADDYFRHIKKSSVYTDKNIIANKIIKDNTLKQVYDFAVLDEVQDFTQKELLAFKHIAKNVFAVGDPLQMINPSYFSFNKLKQLFGEQHKEFVLDLNYRNTKPLNEAVNALLAINKEKLGTHSKILREVKTVNIQESTYLFFTNQNEVFDKLNNSEFNNYIIVVASEEDKKNYQNLDKSKEIFTISEIKGLERGTIVLHNILTSHQKDWQELDKEKIDKKNADENSLLRYYFNIFYVGITRAQRHLLVVEENEISVFKDFFKKNFQYLPKDASIELLQEKLELNILTDEERLARINEAFKNNLLENAQHHINWIKDMSLKKRQQERYMLYDEYFKSKNKVEVRDKFLDKNLIDDAIEISKQIKEFDTANVLNNIYFENKLNIGLCYNVLVKDTTNKIKCIVTNALAKTRSDLSEINELLRDILKEI